MANFNQKVATLTLRQLGFKCDIAENGLQALNMYKDKQYDLILMDMQMPEMDGLQSTKMIREHERVELVQRPCFIVAVTANALVEYKQLCFLSGMNNFLTKPFTDHELRNILLEAVNHHRRN